MMKIKFLLTACLCSSILLAQKNNSLIFDTNRYTSESIQYEGKTIKIRAYEHIIYVNNPTDTVLQRMNIYIPEGYFKKKKINGYTAETAPIFFPNQVEKYAESRPVELILRGLGGTGKTGMGKNMPPRSNSQMGPPQGGAQGAPQGRFGGNPPGDFGNTMVPNSGFSNNITSGNTAPNGERAEENKKDALLPNFMPLLSKTALMAISKGYIVASAGTRGRKSRKQDGAFSGKGSAALVDLKAAIRYLKYNNNIMPGDAEKIIAFGTGAGGALSALIGTTANNQDFADKLENMGAAMTNDEVFAVSAYAPATDLENADNAYEWQFGEINTYREKNEEKIMTANHISKSNKLKRSFPDYVNQLQLKNKNGLILSLDSNGNGSFKNNIKDLLIASAQKAMNAGWYVKAYTQLSIENNTVKDIDWGKHMAYIGRSKAAPAYDADELKSDENQLFGDEHTDAKHFNHLYRKLPQRTNDFADSLTLKMMNPILYLMQTKPSIAKHWYLRQGTNDRENALAIPVILATELQNNNVLVNFELSWDRSQGSDYDSENLFEWLESVCKK